VINHLQLSIYTSIIKKDRQFLSVFFQCI